MNPEDLQLEVKVLMRHLKEFQIDSGTVLKTSPLQSLSDEILSTAYSQADDSIKLKMIALAIVERCPFQDPIINFAMLSLILEKIKPQPTFTGWNQSIQFNCRDFFSFVNNIVDFILEPLEDKHLLYYSFVDCIKLFYTATFNKFSNRCDEKTIIKAFVKLTRTCKGRYSQARLQQVVVHFPSRDASPTRK